MTATRLPAPFFQDELSTIYHAENYEVLQHLHAPDERCVFAMDPPYALSLASAGGDHRKLEWYADAMNGARPFAEVLREAAWLIQPDGCVWQMTYLPKGIAQVVKAMALAGINPVDMCTMRKIPHGRVAYGIIRDTETAVLGLVDSGAFLAANTWAGCSIPSVIEVRRSNDSEHPAEKPISFFKHLLGFTQRGPRPAKLVIDPYMGSGTTLVAARQLGIRAIGIEQNERWCATAKERLLQMQLL